MAGCSDREGNQVEKSEPTSQARDNVLVREPRKPYQRPADSDFGVSFPTPARLHNFDGDIEKKHRIGMTLIFTGRQLRGCFFYHKDLKDKHISGEFKSGQNVILNELDEKGQVVSTFAGHFIENTAEDPRNRFAGPNSPLKHEVLIGTWQQRGDEQKYPFYLGLNNISPSGPSGRYSDVGAHYWVVEQSAQALWNAVKINDRQGVADQIAYPVLVNDRRGSKTITTRKKFLNEYDNIFTEPFRNAILKHVPHNMSADWKGVMLGNGEVWFGSDGKVRTLNCRRAQLGQED